MLRSAPSNRHGAHGPGSRYPALGARFEVPASTIGLSARPGAAQSCSATRVVAAGAAASGVGVSLGAVGAGRRRHRAMDDVVVRRAGCATAAEVPSCRAAASSARKALQTERAVAAGAYAAGCAVAHRRGNLADAIRHTAPSTAHITASGNESAVRSRLARDALTLAVAARIIWVTAARTVALARDALANVVDRVIGSPVAVVILLRAAVSSSGKHGALALTESAVGAGLGPTLTDADFGVGATSSRIAVDASTPLVRDAAAIAIVALSA